MFCQVTATPPSEITWDPSHSSSSRISSVNESARSISSSVGSGAIQTGVTVGRGLSAAGMGVEAGAATSAVPHAEMNKAAINAGMMLFMLSFILIKVSDRGMRQSQQGQHDR